MDFRFDHEERQLIAAAHEAIAGRLPIERIRTGASAIAAWQALGMDGWTHATLAESDGGQEASLVIACAFAREAGRALAPDQWVNNAVLLPRLIASIEAPDVRAAWLARQRQHPGAFIYDGRRSDLRPLASDEALPGWSFGLEDGFDMYVLRSDGADRTELERWSGARVEIKSLAGLAPGVGEVRVLGGVHASAAVTADDAALAALWDEAALEHSAALVGLAEEAERMTLEYVRIRQQFGQPVGRFQAVKHALADVHVLNEVAWNASCYAALRRQEPQATSVARLQAIKAALTASKTMLQLHGGIGFTWESDVHSFLKLSLACATRFGGREARALSLGQGLVETQWT